MIRKEAEIIDKKLDEARFYFEGFCDALKLNEKERRPLLTILLETSNLAYRLVDIKENEK
jgi:hypothetical protein